MKGDFSRVRFGRQHNFNGILPQQGKVLLDSDGIAQTLIENDWHQTAARDWVGPVAGASAEIPDSFKIEAATLLGSAISLTVGTGHIWADGLLVRLGAPGSTVTRTATWIEPPIVPTEGDATNVADGVIDAVFLEVWQRAVNGFEMPDELIEPALGGPDTAERLQTAFAFRLARLKAGQTCASLAFDESGRGRLTASLVAPIVVTGDCPVEGSGGYSGFEHQLYRIEIADSSAAGTRFKWSRLNGGLVGRGVFDPVTHKVTITANLPAITGVNQPGFYLEFEAWDAALGFSRVVAGAPATLNGGVLQCAAAPDFGAYPAAGNVFFRLWDGVSPILSFPISANPNPLENGILLQFDPDAPGKYFPGDYWLFPVRAQGLANPQTLIDARQPQGIVYHRVPLAEITWASSGPGSFIGDTIEDCRSIFPPLTRLKGCCTYRVGDGVTSFGDFSSIQAAVDALPAEGGEICLLPGLFRERVRIFDRRDIVIHGCSWQTRVASPGPISADDKKPINPVSAVFTIVASEHVKLRSFAIEAADGDVGVLVDGQGTTLPIPLNDANKIAALARRGVVDIAIEEMVITASTLPAILAVRTILLRIERNRVAMQDVRSRWPAIFVSGREILVERNWVGLQSVANDREWLPVTVVGELAAAVKPATASVAVTGAVISSDKMALHPGGIQIGGPSVDVYVLENEIEGGSRNGITLGSFEVVDAEGKDTLKWVGVLVTAEEDDCDCTGGLEPPPGGGTDGGGKVVAGGRLRNIHIHRNRIRNMGLCGIGPVAFFDLLQELEIITIDGLNISDNGITRTMLRQTGQLDVQQALSIGYGAICVPDVVNLIVRDNTVTDFGFTPGADACGVLILHGEMIQILGNTILETRDWKGLVAENASAGARGGIVILFGSPPTLPQAMQESAWMDKDVAAQASAFASPVFEPGLPALRVEHNLVRVPLNYGLFAIGYGPMEIQDNHIACGGMVRTKSSSAIAQTVLILNLGTSIELATNAGVPSETYKASKTAMAIGVAGFRNLSNGTVLFTGNMCQLETAVSHQAELTSVTIFTPDHLLFSNNQCWLSSAGASAIMDALLIAGTLNVVGNRFQESPASVFISGLTVGNANVTSQNISTFCLFALGNMLVDNGNLALIQGNNSDLCDVELKRLLSAGL